METEGIMTFKGRVLVPRECRRKVLENLHTDQQGVTNMLARDVGSVWWPGLSIDVGAVWDAFAKCN